MKPRYLIHYGVAAMVATFAFSGAAPAQEMVLKSADVHPTGYPTVAAVEAMGA